MKKLMFCLAIFALLLGCKGNGSGDDDQGYSSENQEESYNRSEVAKYAGTYEIYVDNRFIEGAGMMGFTTINYVTINKDGSCDVEVVGEGSVHYDDCYIDGNLLIIGGGDFVFQTSRTGHSIDFTDDFRRQDKQEHGGISSIIMAPKRR